MDQRSTTEADLYERLFPGSPLPYWLGEALRYPVRDIPTLEDYEREQGTIGVPTEEQSSREVGQGVLDYLTMAHGIVNLLRGGAGTAQELMGKRRGAETFGKEMMETSRRASIPWIDKHYELREQSAEAMREQNIPRPSREGYSSYGYGGPLPSPTPAGMRQGTPPPDMVRQQRIAYRDGQMSREVDGFVIGTPQELPGGRTAQYTVVPIGQMHEVRLWDGERLYPVEIVVDMGDALMRARQLQNRLALAAKDPEMNRIAGWHAQERRPLRWEEGEGTTGYARETRLPWERGNQTMWRGGYEPPPESGRWGR